MPCVLCDRRVLQKSFLLLSNMIHYCPWLFIIPIYDPHLPLAAYHPQIWPNCSWVPVIPKYDPPVLGYLSFPNMTHLFLATYNPQMWSTPATTYHPKIWSICSWLPVIPKYDPPVPGYLYSPNIIHLFLATHHSANAPPPPPPPQCINSSCHLLDQCVGETWNFAKWSTHNAERVSCPYHIS